MSRTLMTLVSTLILFAVIPAYMNAQSEREYLRKGNKLYRKSEYTGSEAMYRRAGSQEKSTSDSQFNLGDALYKQGRFDEAATEYDKAAESYNDNRTKAESFYNLGNALVKSNKFRESINAYINSLKLDPDNIQAKANLAYAQDQLKKQQEEQQQQQQDKNDQEQEQDKSGNNGDQDKQDQDRDNNQKQDNGDQEQQQQQQEGQQPEGTMSREDAERLLDALAAYEKQTKEKVDRGKAAGAKVRVTKNW